MEDRRKRTLAETSERYVVLQQRRRPGRDGSRSGWDVTVVDRATGRSAIGSGRTLEDAEGLAWDRLEPKG
jgi:hypothetical protein